MDVIGGLKVIQNPAIKRGTAYSVNGSGLVGLHPLDYISVHYARDPKGRLDALEQYYAQLRDSELGLLMMDVHEALQELPLEEWLSSFGDAGRKVFGRVMAMRMREAIRDYGTFKFVDSL